MSGQVAILLTAAVAGALALVVDLRAAEVRRAAASAAAGVGAGEASVEAPAVGEGAAAQRLLAADGQARVACAREWVQYKGTRTFNHQTCYLDCMRVLAHAHGTELDRTTTRTTTLLHMPGDSVSGAPCSFYGNHSLPQANGSRLQM